MVDPTTLGVVDKSLGWIDKAFGYLKPYKPQAKSMQINYRNATAEIALAISIPTQMKRNMMKVEVPLYQAFQIVDFIDESFTKVDAAWYEEDGKWKLNPKSLPSSENYRLTLRGQMPRSSIDRLVRIQPALNRDQTEELDRYWLDVMIRDVELVERIWSQIQISEINLLVRVGVERPFSTVIPAEMSEKLTATQDWIRTGLTGDRNAIFRQMQKLRSASRSTKVQPQDILEAIIAMTKAERFSKFVTVDKPFALGEMKRDEQLATIFPKFMMVEAFTDLSLKLHGATGFLAFKRKAFEEEVKKRFESL